MKNNEFGEFPFIFHDYKVLRRISFAKKYFLYVETNYCQSIEWKQAGPKCFQRIFYLVPQENSIGPC